MAEVFRKAKVFVQGKEAGLLYETDEGYEFRYRTEYAMDPNNPAVSLTIPIREEVYRSTVLFPFFDGLIPEGWLLDVAVRNWKLDPADRFGLLLHTCKDCIGDVQVERAEESDL